MADVVTPCAICKETAHTTLCDRCQRVICYGCEVSGGKSNQMLCVDCSDEMGANVRTLNDASYWKLPKRKRTRAREVDAARDGAKS